jgi:hypothetical protein
MKIWNVLDICLLFLAVVCTTHSGSAASKAASDEKEYFAVFMEGKKVGHAIHSRVVCEGKVTTSEEVSITLSRMAVSMTIQMRETSIETTDGKPLGFELEQKLGSAVMTVAGKVDERGKVDLTSTSMGAEQKGTLQWPQGAVMAEGLRLIELNKGMEEGTEYTVKVFSSGVMQAVDTHVRIGPMQNVDLLGRVVALREITTTLNMPGAGNVVSTGYVDEDLGVQKTIMPIAGMNVEMVACVKEFALGKNDVLDVIDKMFLASPEPLNNLAATESITYHLTPKQGAPNPTIPSDDNQRVRHLSNGKAIVTVKPVAARPGAQFPYDGSDAAILEATKPTRFLQSEHKDVIDLARRAIGDTEDAAEAAKKIEAFVGEYVENRSLSVGYASAAEVAASRQGDCSEFAVLTAAMCRAVGIPSRVVVGVAYVGDFGGHQGFGGHAWTQAYVGDKWIGLDASFKGGGRGGYDAGHIALAAGNGNPEDFFNLAAAMGQFKVEKVIVGAR